MSDFLRDGLRTDSAKIQLDDFVLLLLRQIVVVIIIVSFFGAVFIVLIRKITIILKRLIGSLRTAYLENLHRSFSGELEPMHLHELFRIECVVRQKLDQSFTDASDHLAADFSLVRLRDLLLHHTADPLRPLVA